MDTELCIRIPFVVRPIQFATGALDEWNAAMRVFTTGIGSGLFRAAIGAFNCRNDALLTALINA